MSCGMSGRGFRPSCRRFEQTGSASAFRVSIFRIDSAHNVPTIPAVVRAEGAQRHASHRGKYMSRFTIALSGLDESDAAVFTAALDAVPGDTWKLVDQAPCRLLVVDIDTVWGHMDWLRATANGQQVITYTRDAQVRGCDLVLHKPLRVDELTTLLQTLVDADGEHVAPTTEAVPVPTIEAAPAREPEPTPEPPPAF